MAIKERDWYDALKIGCNKEGIERASKIIKDGGIAIFPTDTVYGMGCDPYDKKAVERIYKIKSRDRTRPLPVLTYSIETAERIVQLDQFTRRIVEKFWPGPLTLVLKVTDDRIKESLCLEDKIAIRVPDHRCTLELLKRRNFLVGTSANTSGNTSHTDPSRCLGDLEDYDVFVDGGVIASKGESTIIETEGEEIRMIREGSLAKTEILQS